MEELSLNEKYLEALKSFGDWMTIAEWSIRVAEMYPEVLANANLQAAGQKNPTTGLREIAARISSQTSRGAFSQQVEVDNSERPKRVRFLSIEEQEVHESQEILDDVEPLSRIQKIKSDHETLSSHDQYRMAEIESIKDSLKYFLELDIELDHAKAILNSSEPGSHHPDNIQILSKSHNRMKSSKNWKRFSIDEQISYLKKLIELQRSISSFANIEIDQAVVDALIVRLKNVY